MMEKPIKDGWFGGTTIYGNTQSPKAWLNTAELNTEPGFYQLVRAGQISTTRGDLNLRVVGRLELTIEMFLRFRDL